MRSRDEIARERYGCSFESLSAFAQRTIIRECSISEGPTMTDVDVVRALAVAHDKIAKLERENKDLWEENEDLQLQLLEQDEDSLGGSGRMAQKRTRARVDETLPDILSNAARLRDGTDNEES